MDAATPHLAYIGAAYTAVGVLLAGLIVWMIVNHRRTRAKLRQLEDGRREQSTDE